MHHIDDSLGFILNHAGRRLTLLLALRYQPYDITTEQWSVLNRLYEQDGISQKELSRRAEKDQTNITRILDQLERKGLAERKANEADRRSFLAFITPKGRELNETLLPIENEVIRLVQDGMTEEEVALLRRLLKKLTHAAEEAIQEMGEQS
ncbi:DNA-binding MarR family transcriptional regulator [Paenibacillus phyllosphaerae]|uniref:DNA-binding MarR family transcriptional regulator n=1 Tax=Paenibacillus phyllosphaerae TaxID=274593 RepID=A0A7W5AXU7_9BACL|nr:MarR family transcriptional regulator [Paenibacillus phyllosphaerae]MBB3110738.1 DNA-binding MarR family transcriptional regulator [Paenibacillus phyllosphaerae]